MRATIYNRVSSDDTGKAASVTQQEEANRAECDRRGWTVVAVYTDNDVGASRFSQGERTEYAKLLEHVRAGETDVIVLWEDSRMTRRLDEYTVLRDICRETATLWCIAGSIKDLTNKSDRMATGLTAMMSEESSYETSERVLRSVHARIADGRPHGRLVYGYKREYDKASGEFVRQVPDPETAPIVREIAQRFLAGETMWAIHRDLNARGVPSLDKHRTAENRGKAEWTHNMLRRILFNPHYACIRTRNGVEEPIRGDWEALVSEEDHRAIVQILSQPERRTSKDTQVKHLLSGLALCGLCGSGMRVTKNRGMQVYQCPKCFKTRNLAKVDEVVVEAVVGRMSEPDILDMFSHDDAEAIEAQKTVAMLRAQITETEDAIVSGDLSASSGGRIISALEGRLDEAQRLAVPARLPAAVSALAGPDAAAGWEALSMSQRRDVIRTLTTVVIEPAGAGKRVFDARLIRILWKQ